MAKTVKGKRALVTGASSGLGADFARQLAAQGCHLVLVARRVELLNALADELSVAHGVQVDVVAMDLSEQDAPARLHAQLKAQGKAIDILINNAGFGLWGDFLAIDWEKERNMLELDILTLVHMTRLFAADMVARKDGMILQVSSVGAYQPSPTYASYGAAKAYVLNYGEAVNYELRGTGVTCTVLSPGVTATEFLKVSGQEPTLYQRLVMMKSEDVVRTGLEAMKTGKSSLVPGLLNALMIASNRLIPRQMSAAVTNALMH